MQSTHRARWLLSTCGIAILFYCLVVLAFVGTGPDLGLRFLLVDKPDQEGPVIQRVTSTLHLHATDREGWKKPQEGDILIKMGPSKTPGVRLKPIRTFVDFTRALITLRGPVPRDGNLVAGMDPTKFWTGIAATDRIPPFVDVPGEESDDRQRLVEIEFLRPNPAGGPPETIRTWLEVRSLPFSELALSFIWFLLEMGIFSVGALAFWTRPFDRPARLFFAMCIVTMGAFVGGYHWWIIAGTVWLSVPFSICAVLVPVVTLHFFLIYPHLKSPLVKFPRATLAALYTAPVLAIVGFTTMLIYSAWLNGTDAPAREIRDNLEMLRTAIYVYMAIAAFYFAATLIALIYSFFTTRNPIEHNQVKWILRAALVATVPVSYTLYLAQFQRVNFAVGHGALPMFIASLLFMLAYAYGIVRFKLMLVEESFSREMLYFAVSVIATGVYSLTIASASLIGLYQDVRSSYQKVILAGILMVAVILLSWLKNRFQQIIDLRYFREKYQLDKALESMNQTIGQLVEPEILAERLLATCRNVLLVDRAALYLREQDKDAFRLVASQGHAKAPLQFQASEDLLKSLLGANSLQRVITGSRDAKTPVQMLLRQLNSDMLQALEIDGVIAGVVLLGAKRNGVPYSAEDRTFLTAMGQVTSVALHSAQVHRAVAGLNQELRLKVEKITEQQRQISMLQSEITARQDPAASPSPAPTAEPDSFRRGLIKGSSPAIQQVLETVRKVSNSQSSVLIRGESGTGKELLAQAIHENSPRRAGPMVSVHCGALAPGLLESELFGHVKGAFTGAHRDRAGRFEMADGGTLFLDEIGDISLDTQIKLLRVLQERTFEPVGGTRAIQVDVRVIAATHQNLERLIAEGKFREDLYYRLNVISITLPPLRERTEDIFELALHFLTRAAKPAGKHITHIDEPAVEALKRHAWPGNIRELENAIERAIVLAEQEVITIRDLPPEFLNGGSSPRRADFHPDFGAPESRFHPPTEFRVRKSRDSEREQLVTALERTGGNKAEAARLLGLPRSTFFSKLKKHAID